MGRRLHPDPGETLPPCYSKTNDRLIVCNASDDHNKFSITNGASNDNTNQNINRLRNKILAVNG